MLYRLEYVYSCNKGESRRVNQDNFVCGQVYLPPLHENIMNASLQVNALDESFLLAVFDGIGGEMCGEMASWIAADTFHNWDLQRGEKSLIEGCMESNRRIVHFAQKNKLGVCGSSAAMLLFDHEGVIRCNIGDSRIYRLHGNEFQLLSNSDVFPGSGGRQRHLSQYLGIPENEVLITPHMERYRAEDGDLYLICSNGLTDMLTEKRIYSILRCLNPETACIKLRLGVLDAGSPDDFTFLLIRLRKQ